MSRRKQKRTNTNSGAGGKFSPRPKVTAPAPDVSVRADGERSGWTRVKIAAELLEDTHPGSGSGGGGIDALVSRDRRGEPVIWASHLEGVLRDAARRLYDEDVAADLFGQAGGHHQRAVFTSLYLPSAESQAEKRIWRSSARAAFDNRAPRHDTLRVVEYVAKGVKFEGQVQLPASELKIWRRLFQEVDALGSGRASGAGRVRFSCEEVPTSTHRIANGSGRLVLLLRNLDPLCITATATPDNLIPSLAFVPGRALLGALANWLITENRRDAATLLVNGNVSVSDALPIPKVPTNLSLAEVLPAPLCLQSEKPTGVGGKTPWWAQDPVNVRRLDSRNAQAPGPKLKRPEPDLYVFRENPTTDWVAYRPQRRVRLRNGRPDPGQDNPSLFAIEQIVEGTLFLCDVRGLAADMTRIASSLASILNGERWLRVGRAGAPVAVAGFEWSHPSPTVRASQGILTLTSDLLARDEYLRWRTKLDAATFGELPGWPGGLTVNPVIQDAVTVHGFNGTSRLWRMPASGIRRGSVFEVQGDTLPELTRMIAEGRWLGERTHEGFGRFRIDRVLPGVHDGPSATPMAIVEADDPDEKIATTTREWFESHRSLAAMGAGDRRPSLSQWLDLVGALERGEPDALSSRQNPSTAGAKNWHHTDASAILTKLARIDAQQRAAYSRLFVRWLRAHVRRDGR